MGFAKTDLVPNRPNGEGWFLLSNLFCSGYVCKCGNITDVRKAICLVCGISGECAEPCAYLFNEWRRNYEYDEAAPVWYNRNRTRVATSYERAVTYGPCKPVETC